MKCVLADTGPLVALLAEQAPVATANLSVNLERGGDGASSLLNKMLSWIHVKKNLT